jgi:hypothetical protein
MDVAKIMCPVLETGKYSVKPSTIAIIIASIIVMVIFCVLK